MSLFSSAPSRWKGGGPLRVFKVTTQRIAPDQPSTPNPFTADTDTAGDSHSRESSSALMGCSQECVQEARRQASLTFRYDGNVTTISSPQAGTSQEANSFTPVNLLSSYTLDDAGRLACVYRDGQLVAHHVYDDNGNRIGASSTCNGDTAPAGVTGASIVEAERIGPNNQLATATVRDVFGGEHQYTYAYDGTGALATKVEAPNNEHPNTRTP